MLFLTIFFVSFWIFSRTLSYGIFEIKKNNNTIGGIVTIVIAVISLILPNIIVYIRGFY